MQAILAVYSDWGIGRDGTQPEVIPEDRARFQKLTRGNCVIYGRRTMLDFPGGRPLKGRQNIIISSTLKSAEGAMIAASKEEAIELAGRFENVFIIGGASVFRLFMEELDRVYITKVFSKPVSDVFFPNLDEDDEWRISEQSEMLTSENGMKYQYLTYEKNKRSK